MNPPDKVQVSWRQRAAKIAAVLLTLVVLGVVIHHARSLAWGEILDALRDYPLSTLALTLIFPAVGFSMLAAYDLLARQYIGRQIPATRILRYGFIAYAFTLNIGTLVGGLALRLRLYGRQGLDAARVSQVTALAVITNWSGYMVMAGALFLFAPPQLPAEWKVSSGWLRVIGFVMLAQVAGYFLLCVMRHGRTWRLRQFEFTPLPLPRALLQVGMASLSWTMMALAIHQLMPAAAPLPTVMAGFFVASVAGLVLRVPAGLGVLEGVMAVLLAPYAPTSRILAAVLAYRALYLILPLLLAAALLLIEELRARFAGKPQGTRAGSASAA